MEKQLQENIAYEMAMLVRCNRELREELKQKDAEIKDLVSLTNKLNNDLAQIRSNKIAERSKEISKICDIDVRYGDRVVFTWTRGDAHCVGEVYEVAKHGVKGPLNTRKGETYFTLNVKKLDEEGIPTTGRNSVFGIRSCDVNWRKVDVSTPLSKRVYVADIKDNLGRILQGHFEFKNLMKL